MDRTLCEDVRGEENRRTLWTEPTRFKKTKARFAACCLLENMLRQLKLPANANPPSKRKPIRASSHQTTPPAMQPPSVPYRRTSAQVADPTNQSMPSYQNQSQHHTAQHDTSQTDNLGHLTASPYPGGLVTSIPEQMYYQEQQSSQSKSNTSS
jgi:hypothetical protein